MTILALDTKEEDRLGEFDTGTHTFTPREDGWYLVNAAVLFHVGADQDLLRFRFYNLSAGAPLSETYRAASGPSYQSVTLSAVLNLNSGDDHRFYAQNSDSDDTIGSNNHWTFAQIKRVY